MARAALSPAFAGLRGALGDMVIVQRPDGPIVRRRVVTRRETTPAQRENERRMALVSQAWQALDDATYGAWLEYAETQAYRNPSTGAIVRPRAYNLFVGLASKARQVDSSLSLVGFMPPAQAFAGDGVIVAVAQASLPAKTDVSTTEASTTLGLADFRAEGSVFAGTEACTTLGVLTFSADRANAPGVVTELLIQPLANRRRAVYKDKYVSRGFFAFAPGSLEATVECPPGAYACAIRFVRAATGQETAIVALGVVEVA
ncbi:hypothetical protein EON82_02830 [bacterium]|nr:MAG: hypothetical protein EON82_02830 [bacterium]